MIPPSVDELMWLLADQREPSAVESFLKRYPDLRPELLRRMRMVAEMKGMKNEIPVPTSLPAFQPTPGVAAPRARWWLVPSLAFGLLAVGYASFWVTRVAAAPVMPAERPVVSDQHQVSSNPQPAGPQQATPQNAYPVDPQLGVNPSSPEHLGPNDVPPVKKPEYSDLLLKPVELWAKETPSQQIITDILAQVKLRPVFGPKMTNELCDLEAHEVSAKDALTELGEKAGFTFFEQGDGTVLILPAVDQKPKFEGK